ncbi:MAG: 3-dehydroquinate synthase, partial [Planctomycetota bacterium]|nr:3-dehydroquinate synthase [Planctomycetota bacterium]
MCIRDRLNSLRPYKVGIVTSKEVETFCGEEFYSSLLRDGDKYFFYVEDGEKAKRLESVERLWRRLVEAAFTRRSLLIGFGGGSVCDVAGFVASTFNRGLPLLLVPTTLLAQVDAAIGGKNGIDFYGKNLIGTFYQPRLVISDTRFLVRLSERQMCNGIAESVKIAVVSDRNLFQFIKSNSEKIIRRDSATITELVERSIRVKLRVVKQDEKEEHLRRILNFGHTFGHAYESLSGYSLSHGEAVSAGMLVASKIAEKVLGFEESSDVVSVLKALKLPTKVPSFKSERVLKEVRKDKKFWFGNPSLVLPDRIGRAKVVEFTLKELSELYEEVRNEKEI